MSTGGLQSAGLAALVLGVRRGADERDDDGNLGVNRSDRGGEFGGGIRMSAVAQNGVEEDHGGGGVATLEADAIEAQ